MVQTPEIFGSKGMDTGMNLAFFSNDEIDAKIEEISVMTSIQDMDQAFKDLHVMIYKEAPWIFVYNFMESLPFSKKVHVPYFAPTDIFYFQPWVLEVTKEMS